MSKITENMPDRSKTMRAVLWEGKVERMTVKDVPIPRIEHPEDVIVRTIVSAICGSDLHTWRGELGSHQVPWVMGHEAVGIVIEVGAAVDTIKKGDKVVVPDFPDPGNIVVRSSQVPQQPGETFPEAPNEQIGPGIYGFGADFGNDLGGCQGKCEQIALF
jgi:threonine dehydrogenase-like Zn-dependent dehydrogenase